MVEIELPSNKKFGFFFTFVFFFLTTYCFWEEVRIGTYMFGSLTIVFLIITILNPNKLHFLNKLWMRLGLFLGMIVSPIVLASIFFFLITPVAIISRISGRDQLLMKFKKRKSHWIERDKETDSNNFKNQF